MKMSSVAQELGLKCLTPELKSAGEINVTGGHSSDLLSDVLANAPDRGVLVTLQVHLNVIAVAVHAGLSAIIFSGGRLPEDEVRAKAVEEHLPLYVSEEPTFDVVGRLYGMGLRGGAR
jgi:hypothetical protein